MNDFIFSNSENKCHNSSCKFVKNHGYPCSNALSEDVQRCENRPCCKSNGHSGNCLFYKNNENENQIVDKNLSSVFNMQYQSLINDYKRYSNFNNNNDQRKFIINYTTNNFYIDSKNTNASNNLEDIINSSKFIPQFTNPSSHLDIYRR